jgi:hypothetical protein
LTFLVGGKRAKKPKLCLSMGWLVPEQGAKRGPELVYRDTQWTRIAEVKEEQEGGQWKQW